MWHKQALYLVAVNGHCADRFRRGKFQHNDAAEEWGCAGLWGICPHRRVKVEVAKQP